MKELFKIDVKILVFLRNNSFKNNYPPQLSKDINATYSHCLKRTQELIKEGMIYKNGGDKKKSHIHLTDKGIEVANYLIKINELIK